MEDCLETIRRRSMPAQETYEVKKFGINRLLHGGTYAFAPACEMPELGAAAPFYGGHPGRKSAGKADRATLFIAGTRDAWIIGEGEQAERDRAQIHCPSEVVSYDADHAFFNDTRPEVYDRKQQPMRGSGCRATSESICCKRPRDRRENL